jgi:hypothetical protein
MKHLLLAFLFLIPLLAKAEEPDRVLSPEDYQIYLETFNKCHTGTAAAAFRASFNPKIMISAASNLTRIMSLSVEASKARMEAHGLSPETYRLLHSDGYAMAFRDCYTGSSELRLSLIKNMIDMGHLSSELIGTIGTLYVAGEMLALKVQMMKLHPVATRLVFVAGMSYTLNTKFQFIKKEFFDKPTPQETVLIHTIEKDMFKDVNGTMAQIIALAALKVQSLDAQLANPNLSFEERKAISAQREKLVQQAEDLRRSIKE